MKKREAERPPADHAVVNIERVERRLRDPFEPRGPAGDDEAQGHQAPSQDAVTKKSSCVQARASNAGGSSRKPRSQKAVVKNTNPHSHLRMMHLL